MKKPGAKATNDNIYKDNELFQDDTAEENAEEDMEYYCVNSTRRRGRSLSSGGPPRPDTAGMSAAKALEAIKEWRVPRRAHADKMQREHRTLFGSNTATEIEYSGVVDARLWLMSDVEVTPLLKGHTFPMKEILLIWGCAGSLFQVKASCSIKLGWKVTTIKTRKVTKANDDPADESFMTLKKRWRMRTRPFWRRMMLTEK